MPILFLIIGGIICLLASGGVLILQQYYVNKRIIVIDPNYNGPAQVSVTLHVIIRHMLRRSVYARKFFMQYIMHVMVIMIHYVDIWSSRLYAKSRNWFVKNAVKNRGTVPHFWEHLKVYKQEMDKEKDEN